MLLRLKAWAAALKRESLILWFASRDARTPWPAKWLAVIIVAYALSPIDLIPDFIPVVGYLDEIVLLPGAIWLALRFVPEEVLLDARARAQAWQEAERAKPRNWIAAAAIVVLWIAGAWAIAAWIMRPARVAG